MMLNVAIYAEVSELGTNGGLESMLIGFVTALGRLPNTDQRYTIIGPTEDPHWLDPYLGENQRIVHRPRGRATVGAKVRSLLRPPAASWPSPPISSGFYESLNCDLIHFTYQHFEITSLPSIYTPHDLQHLHYPQFFSPFEIARRESMYRTGCQLARKVTVGSQWIKQDIVGSYSVDPNKVEIIPWAPPTQAYAVPTEEGTKRTLALYGLKRGFALYPAVTWPHKNHLRLLDALALLRDEHGLSLDLVCTGHRSSYFDTIVEKQRSLGLDEQVRFLGRIPGEELRSLYRSARFVIVPTLFEAASGPVFEAWSEGVAVACANVTSLPEQAGDAALLFDPLSVQAIAKAMTTLYRDEKLRSELIARGTQRLQDFNWEATAQAYRSLYRRVAESRSTLSPS